MGRTADDSSPLAACVAPSDAVRASPQPGGFQVNSSLILLRYLVSLAIASCLSVLEDYQTSNNSSYYWESFQLS